jgi:hypothetical protein
MEKSAFTWAMSGGDGTDSSTQVHIIRGTWVPMAMFHRARHSTPLSPEDLTPMVLPGTEKHWALLPGARVCSESGHV